MKEKDWDYVFQGNSIQNCVLVDNDTSSFKKALFAKVANKLYLADA